MPDAGDALTEAHRLDQVRISARTQAALVETWELLDGVDLAGSTDLWLDVNSAVIGRQAAASAALSAEYYSALRETRIGEALDVPAVVRATPEQVRTSLRVTGPIAVRTAQAAGATLEQAMLAGRSSSTAAGARHVLDGGRGTLEAAVTNDQAAAGWARVTSGRPCAFCAMMASRGAVYRSARTAGNAEKYHDGCHCTVVPIFSADAALPGLGEHYRELWSSSTAGLSGADARSAFARALREHPEPKPLPTKARRTRKPKYDAADFDRIAEQFGVSVDEVQAARAQVVALRRRVYDEAAATAADSFRILDAADALSIRPPGRGFRGGEFDWLERLDPNELVRLRRGGRWFSTETSNTVDEVAERLRNTVPGLRNMTDDEVIRTVWLHHTRQIEASGAIRRGKLPTARQYSGDIDPADFAPIIESEGYDVVRLFADDLEAAGHIAQVNASQYADEAARVLDAYRTGDGPAPWEMSFQSWEAELRDLEYARDGILSEGITPEQTARLRELLPPELDGDGFSYEDAYGAVVTTARQAGYRVPAHAVVDWAEV
jgi:hypothetical protein